MNEVPISLLKPHPKNNDYYDNLPDDKYQEIKHSIEAHGIRDPLKVTPDYTVIAGHQRLRIAKELGLEKVPVVILDVTSEEAEYLLIADNEERRQSDGDNPMKKARRAEFLKRYWNVRRISGRERLKGQNDLSKTLADVAKAIGEDESTTKRLLKLNDLIPALQTLVAEEKLTQTAAHSLAFLPPEEQEHLLKTLGESGICGLSVKEAQELRHQVEAALKERDELAGKLAEAQERERDLERQIASVRQQAEDLEAEITEKLGREYEGKLQSELSDLRKQLDALKEERDKARRETRELCEKLKQGPQVVYRPDPEIEARIAKLDAAIKTKENELTSAQKQLATERARLEELHKKNADLQEKLKVAREEASKLHESLNNYLRANAELKGHAITQETRFRSAITTAAKAIGEAVGRVKIEFREDFRHNKDLVDRVHTLARHLQDAAQELLNLAALNGTSSRTVDVEEKLTDVDIIDVN